MREYVENTCEIVVFVRRCEKMSRHIDNVANM